MKEIIQLQLNVGLTTFSGKLGTIKNLVDILPPPNPLKGPTLVFEVDPTVTSVDCPFHTVTFGQKVDEAVVGGLLTHIGKWFVYSTCMVGPYQVRRGI